MGARLELARCRGIADKVGSHNGAHQDFHKGWHS